METVVMIGPLIGLAIALADPGRAAWRRQGAPRLMTSGSGPGNAETTGLF